MTKPQIRPIALPLLTAASLATAAHAEPQEITLRLDLHPATQAAAQHSLRKIDDAALRVCGASGFSLTEVKIATRAGECWKEAAGNAVRASGDPLLAQAFARFPSAAR